MNRELFLALDLIGHESSHDDDDDDEDENLPNHTPLPGFAADCSSY